MFKKGTPEQTAITVIAVGTCVEGTLRVRGRLQIDGSIEGTLVSEGPVSVGPQGKVSGDIDVDSLSVAGLVEGTVRVHGHLHVLAHGNVRGEARYATLEVDRGGVMDGRTGVLADNDGQNEAAADADAAE